MPHPTTVWADHIAAVKACRLCPGVQPPPVLGAVPGASVYLVGQAPGPKEMVQGRPFVFTAGTTLFKWFASIGVPEEEFRAKVYMAAVIRCFPGKLANKPGAPSQGDRKPSREEIANCRPHQQAELRMLQPGLVIPVGKMAIEQFLPPSPLDDVVGQAFPLRANGGVFDAIPLPHPSGLSRWIQKPEGKARIRAALALIREHPAWVETFGRRKAVPSA